MEGIRDCAGLCYFADYQGDDYCDAEFDCQELGYDGGDCGFESPTSN